MGLYKHLRELWKSPKKNLGSLWKEHLIEWRKDPVTLRIDRPTRLDRARSIGYRAKQGFVIVRQRIMRGGKKRPHDRRGRRSKHSRLSLVMDKNYQQISEERAAKKYKNCEVLGSYYLAKDGKYIWHEIILVDRTHPEILSDKRINWISLERGRAFKGLTSSGRRARGLLNKGKGAEKLRPSKSANRKRRL